MCSRRWAMPVSPYPSWRDPTKTVMLTVTVDEEGSGKRRSRAPFLSVYSVIPSTVATFCGVSTSWAARRAGIAELNRARQKKKDARAELDVMTNGSDCRQKRCHMLPELYGGHEGKTGLPLT